MKYAFMSFSTPASGLTEMIDIAERYGYDGIEPRLDSEHAHGIEVETSPERRREIAAEIKESDIALACLATSLKYADPARTDEMIRQSHERIDLAGDLEAPMLRIFGGKIPEGLSREAAIDQVVSCLSRIADHAGERGVVVCMETHDDWCDPTHVAAVLKRVNHPAVAANWDIMHPVRIAKCSIDDAFNALKPWIRHLHVHDGADSLKATLLPIGTGAIDHRRAMELLIDSGYEGYMSGEWIRWEPWETHLPRELAALKNYEQEFANG